jgi:hypothetical protein
MTKYNQETEALMLAHYSRLLEPLRRQHAYLEAKKLGRGGKTYISKLFGISQKTIRKGEAEVGDAEMMGQIPAGRQRRLGGGRKKFCPVARSGFSAGSTDRAEQGR